MDTEVLTKLMDRVREDLKGVESIRLVDVPTPQLLQRLLRQLRDNSILLVDVMKSAVYLDRTVDLAVQIHKAEVEDIVREAMLSNPRVRAGASVEEKKARAMDVAMNQERKDTARTLARLQVETSLLLEEAKLAYKEQDQARSDISSVIQTLKVQVRLEF